MSKKRTNISLDPEVYKQAKEIGINISQTSEQALRFRIEQFQSDTFSQQQLSASPILLSREQTESATSSTSLQASQRDVDEFLTDFKQTCKIDWGQADSTIKERMRYARKLVDHLDGHPLTASKEELREFISQFDDQNAIKTVRVVYGRYLDTDIAESFKVQPTPPKPKKVPKKTELQQVYHKLDNKIDEVGFLLLATSGLRRRELMELTAANLEPADRAIYPSTKNRGTTKRQWVTFYNEETESRLNSVYDLSEMTDDDPLFEYSGQTLTRHIREASEAAGVMKITPRVLRIWFCNEMNHLGVPDRYIDAFCGRTPKSVLAKHYSDYTPRKLKEIYNDAEIAIIESICT